MSGRRRLGARLASIAASGALALGTIALAAPPASAASVTGYGSGPVGLTQTINAQGICPSSQLTLDVTYSGGATYSTTPVWADINGNATIYWAPPVAGFISQATIGSTCTPFPIGTATISKTGTSSTISAPNTTKIGQSTLITVTVRSNGQSTYQPTGTVVVKDANGAVLQTMGLTPGPGTGQAYAYYRWTPTQAGTYYVQASYGGDTNAGPSTSAQDSIIATGSGSTISLSAPSVMTQGVPVTLVASVFPAGVRGSVGFTLNGAPISASIPIVNGQASFLWTPTVTGNVTLGASYTTNQGGSGSTSDNVTIVPGPVAKDVITLTQPGVGIWGPNAAFQVQNGTTFTFQASTLSGAGVTLTETGPCQVSGLTLVVDTGNGQCNLTASSAGGNGYAPVQQGYTVITIPGTQTAALAAPGSGKVNKGKTLTLEKASQGTTNAGQNITWKITKGKNKVCKLKFPSNGSVKLKMLKKGYCNVKASAPGVASQWNPYTLTRSYQGV